MTPGGRDPDGAARDPATLHLMSLNVCGLPAKLAPLAERAGHFGDHIERSDLDVVNFQEVLEPRTLKAIRGRLPSFPFVAWKRAVGGRPAGGLVTFSRRPIGAVSYQSFRGIRPTAGSLRFRARGTLNSRLRGVLTVELPEAGAVVVNTHLTANRDGDWSAQNRYHGLQRAQVRVVHAVRERARAAAPRLVVVSGDFNIASDGPLYPLITDGGAWLDPFAATDPVTFHQRFLPPGSPPHRIDYILVSPGTAVPAPAVGSPAIDSAVLFDEPWARPDGRRLYLSDHMALTARIPLPPAAG